MADNNVITSYQQLVSSYQAIDNFRAQLLARLPLATGAGIFLLYATNTNLPEETKAFLPAIGLFGFVVTLGLFVYEFYGIMKCTALINTGKQIENTLRIDGQFLSRPASFFNEPFAAGLIYPAVLTAWAYLGLAFVNTGYLLWVVPLVFIIFLIAAMSYNLRLYWGGQRTDLIRLNQDILHAEEYGNQDAMTQYLHLDFTIVRSNGEKENRDQFLKSIPANKNIGRIATQANVQVMDQCAIYTCIVNTTKKPDETPSLGRFWNTRLFVKENSQWACISWQVMKISAVD